MRSVFFSQLSLPYTGGGGGGVGAKVVALILIINKFVDIQPVLSKFCDNSENVLNIKKN